VREPARARTPTMPRASGYPRRRNVSLKNLLEKMAKTTLLRIVPLIGTKNNRLYVKRGKDEVRIVLIGGDTALERLGTLIESTGKPWREFIRLDDHEEYGEFAYVDGSLEADPLYD